MTLTVRRRSPNRYFEMGVVVVGFVAPWLVRMDWTMLGIWVVGYVGLRALLRRAWDPLTQTTATVARARGDVELRYAGGRTEMLGAVEWVAERTKPERELRIERTGKPLLRVVVPPGLEPAALLTELGLGTVEVRKSYTLGSLGARLFWIVILGVVGPYLLKGNDGAAADWMRWFARVSYLPALLLAVAPTRCELARDGVAWQWMWVRRFVSFADIEALHFYPDAAPPEKRVAVRITTRTGASRRLLASRVSGRFFVDLPEELEAYRARSTEAPGRTWMRQPAEALRVWIERVRALGSASGGYRGLVEDPWPVAEDPTAPALARCGALLFACGRPEALARASAIARSVARPALREAMAAIAEGGATDVVEARLRALGDDARAPAETAAT